MKRMLVFLTLLLLYYFSYAIDVSGTQTGTWALADSPIRIVGDVTIPASNTLTVEAGVVVNFTGAYIIDVSGTLNAIGAMNDSIIFKHETAGQRHFGIVFGSGSAGTLRYCRLQDGTSVGSSRSSGGFMQIQGSSPIIDHCLFKNNSSTAGGAIAALFGTSTTISNCMFLNNTVTQYGGAITINGAFTTATPNIFNSVFYNNSQTSNSSDYGGGAVSFYGNCTANFQNNVVFGNTASGPGGGGGVALIASNLNITISNCIFWGNTASVGAQINDAGTNTLTVQYSDVEGGFTGTGNLNSGPLFVSAQELDFHLTKNSPCIDVGNASNAPATDFDGNPTNQDGNASSSNEYDMGAFEFLNNRQNFDNITTSQSFSIDTYEAGAPNSIGTITLNGTVSGSDAIDISVFTKSFPHNAPTGSKAIHRWYRIADNGGNLTYTDANLTLYYGDEELALSGLAEGNLTLWKYENGAWVNKGGTVNVSNNSITVTNVNPIGDWAFADINDSSLPVTLSLFNARFTPKGIQMYWQTASETNNLGFEVWKSTEENSGYVKISDYNSNSALKGLGNSSQGQFYSVIDRNFTMNTTYYYKVVSVDLDGSRKDYGPARITVTEQQLEALSDFEISGNYPNPFNPTTHISIILPEVADISLRIYNSLGQLVEFKKFPHTPKGSKILSWDGANVASGVYFYEVYVNSKRYHNTRMKSGKMMLLR